MKKAQRKIIICYTLNKHFFSACSESGTVLCIGSQGDRMALVPGLITLTVAVKYKFPIILTWETADILTN